MRKFLLRVRDRQVLFGFELIRCERNHVELSPTAQIDLAEFLKIIAAPGSSDLMSLCEIYRGDLLEGVEWEAAESNEWIAVRRTKLRDAFVALATSHIEPVDPSADKIQLRMAARRLIEIDPYNETAHRTLMTLYSEAREPASVSDAYRKLAKRLHDELGVEPDAATTDLFNSLLPAREAVRLEAERAPAERVEIRSEIAFATPQSEVGLGAVSPIGDSGAPKVTILPPAPVGGSDVRHQIAVSLVEDVTINLCRSRSLSVVAPHTAWELSISGKKDVFSSFGIDYSVETQLQIRAGDPWLSVKLVNAASRHILWTEQYDLNRTQTAQSYRTLSVQILSSLVDRIERIELAHYDAEQNPSAYHLYLVGRQYLHSLDLPSVRRARRAFREAIAACNDFVPGLTGLARTLQLEWLLRAHGDNELIIDAEKLARRSIEIDPDDAHGYRELGVCQAYAGQFEESLTALAEGEQRNPQYADLLNDYADALVHACEPAAALHKIERAIELNPLCPDQYWWAAAGANYQLENYAEAVACMSRMRDQTPALRLLAASWGMLGDKERAGEYARLTKETHPDFRIGSWLTIMPFRDPQVIRRYEDGLRAAGFE